MLRACAIDFGGNWDEYLPLVEFAYNNSYQASIQMASYEGLHGRHCRSPIGWFEPTEVELLVPDSVHEIIEKVNLIVQRLKTAQSQQKSYTDMRHRELEFSIGDKIVRRTGKVVYKLKLPSEMAMVHPVFHISMLRLYKPDPSHVLTHEEIEINEVLSYKEEPVQILDRQVRRLRTKYVASVKVLWRNHNTEEENWEAEEDIKKRYPHLFPISGLSGVVVGVSVRTTWLLLQYYMSFVRDSLQCKGIIARILKT
ncbi:uncharacterized protein LOC132048964 [Lycium ferocissimum]|uniref:uncharacterized protein LOC132048964 n=1 Tax=Lycium ferocissimum TaxID=112874 RepID=UPI00281664F5|nr:uncharacterized protein LOC132048964 [Lycium ferocissimum]